MSRKRLSKRMRLIIAFLEVHGPSTTGTILKIVYPGQEVFLGRQRQYLLRTLLYLEENGFIESDATSTLWQKARKS